MRVLIAVVALLLLSSSAVAQTVVSNTLTRVQDTVARAQHQREDAAVAVANADTSARNADDPDGPQAALAPRFTFDEWCRLEMQAFWQAKVHVAARIAADEIAIVALDATPAQRLAMLEAGQTR